MKYEPVTQADEEGDECVQWSERNMDCCGFRMRRWFWVIIVLLFVTTVSVLFYALCRLDNQ